MKKPINFIRAGLLSLLVLLAVRPTLAQPLSFELLLLPNGLKIFYQQDPEVKFTTVVFHLAGGQSLEKTGESGLAYLATRLMAEVSDEDRLAGLLASGVNLSAGSRADFSVIRFEGPSQQLGRIMEIISAGLKKPLFSGPRIDNVRKTMKLEARKEACRLIEAGLVCLRRQIFPGSSYGQSLYGRQNDLMSLGKKEISRFYESVLNSGELSLLVVSDLDKKIIQELAAQHLSLVKKSEPAERKIFSAAEKKQDSATDSGCDYYQGPAGAAVILAYVLPGELRDIYPAAYLMEKIIGEGPGSIIWSLRQEAGLAYNLNSRLEVVGGRAIFICYMETEPERARTGLTLLQETFGRLGREGLAPEIITSGQTLARNSYLRQSLERDNRLGFLSLLLANNLSLDFNNRFLELIEAVSPDRLNELIRSTFSQDRAYEVLIIRE
ncbi:MAG: M16 family metallopeptidase [Candidatus Saccharicenans sp.]|uniref:M16 family metallopeptidase n=1 Tax=Candidatus Saccharicenans sp. TaxID=2819258 RepID=UPI00404A678C